MDCSFIVTMNFSFDKIANTLYIQFSNEKVSNSDEIVDGIIFDYSEDDYIIGVEILNYE